MATSLLFLAWGLPRLDAIAQERFFEIPQKPAVKSASPAEMRDRTTPEPRFTGDTRLSTSSEARSMSPPHWGAEPQAYPAENTDPRPSPLAGIPFTLPLTLFPEEHRESASPDFSTQGVVNRQSDRSAQDFSAQNYSAQDFSAQDFSAQGFSAQGGVTARGASTENRGSGLPGRLSGQVRLREQDREMEFGDGRTPQIRSDYQSVLDWSDLESNRGGLLHEDKAELDLGRQPALGAVSPFAAPQSMQERGFQQSEPVHRGVPLDDGTPFDFEAKKKQYPPFSEILATGRFFAMTELDLIKPYFNGNAALVTQTGAFQETFQADHAFETAPRFRVGFESRYGPGAELQYFQFDQNSNPISFVSDGVTQASTAVDFIGLTSPVSLSASAVGETLTVEQSLEVHSMMLAVFKEVQLPISRINGILGLRHVSIAQRLQGRVTDAGGNQLGFLDHVSDFHGYGPTFGIEYFRPVGHTQLELLASAQGSLLLGNRDQFVNRSNSLVARRTGMDELVTTLDILAGVQYQRHYREWRSFYARLGYINQVWLNGGNPNSPLDDFGFRGVGFAFGVNR